MEKTKTHLRFEELATNFFKTDLKNSDFNLTKDRVKPGKLQPYANMYVQQAFILYTAGIEDGKRNSSGHFIIGKMGFSNGKRTPIFSKNPVIHETKYLGKQELKRLSQKFPDSTFILYSSVTMSSNNKNQTEGDMNTKTPFAMYVDDGFGNRRKVPFETRVQFFKENQILI